MKRSSKATSNNRNPLAKLISSDLREMTLCTSFRSRVQERYKITEVLRTPWALASDCHIREIKEKFIFFTKESSAVLIRIKELPLSMEEWKNSRASGLNVTSNISIYIIILQKMNDFKDIEKATLSFNFTKEIQREEIKKKEEETNALEK
ncbi:hypothetical protein V1477_010984 [Vespula maculifrons]|uniref:Uncharacterized protein n=1 Tax=Vespula maculifrons TaxID=7453 RepID=A0ABD2C3K7_VESMC